MEENNTTLPGTLDPTIEESKKPVKKRNWKKIAGIVGLVVLVLGTGTAVAYTMLNGGSSTGVDSTTLSGSGETITLSEGENLISKAGIYTVTGTVSSGYIHVKASDTEEVKIILTNASITNPNGPAIYIESNGNTYIELVGENKINATATSDLNGAIYSKADLLFSGDGSLDITSTIDGIVSKDDLEIDSGTYTIKADDDGIVGKDSVLIKDGTYTINSTGLGIKTSNEEEKGDLEITGGTFNITSTGKGIKAEGNMHISGGKFTIKSADDSVHSNADITLDGGEFTIETDDDGIHGDGKVVINDGTYTITAHEGIEGTYIVINGGTIVINASDDGINAANKSDTYSVKVEINGGDITIKMGQGDTDGIDSNGDIVINGGTINITCNSPFDYDGTATYNGGTLITNGTKTTTIVNQFENEGGMPGGQGGQQGGQQPGSQNGQSGQSGGRMMR